MAPQKDVPIARRVHNHLPPPKKRSYGWIVGLVIIFLAIAIALITTIITNLSKTKAPEPISIVQNPSDPTTTPENKQNQLLGHFAYDEAPLNSLEVVAIPLDGHEIKLRTSAAVKYKQMVADANADGVALMAISGFRSKEDQRQLFFEISRQRNQTPAQRAKVSAPAGYSEHHTGYAIDIGDRNSPSTILDPRFDRTSAFRWLEQNASKYSFELSFPANNTQGVMYEPWHWRFVGDDDSLATFYKKK
jgi:zinc D-Ala-D-Ala carboxypeptidase